MPSIRPGQVILGQFRVDAFIAAGGMGAVYRVWDFKRQVALAMKVLHLDLTDEEDVFKQLVREAKALQQLAHPNIVPFYGLYRTQNAAFLLERFIDGFTLKELLNQRKSVSRRDVLTILKAVSAALSYAHSKGFVHCDVKPGNVMIERGGNVYLADFGIARQAESTTTTLAVAGTPAYMAPEQILGKEVTPATDVYALGVMAYELLAGRRPFTGKEKIGDEPSTTSKSERLRRAHLKLKPPDPRRFNPSLPKGVAAALLKALAKRPEQRFQNTWQFFKALCAGFGITPEQIPNRLQWEKFADATEATATTAVFGVGTTLPQESVGNYPPPPPYSPPPQRTAGTMPKWVIPAIVGVVVLLGAFVVVMALAVGKKTTAAPPPIPNTQNQITNNAKAQQPQQQQPPAPTSPPASQPTARPKPPAPTNTPIPPTPKPSPTPRPLGPQGHVAFEHATKPGNYDIYIMNADGSGRHPLLNTDANERYPNFSPDGRFLAYASDEYGTYDIFVYDLQTGSRQRLTNWGSLEWYPAWSPDGRYIVFSSNHISGSDTDFDLFIMEWQTGSVYTLTSGSGTDNLPAWSPNGDWIAFQRAWGGKWNVYLIHPNGNGLYRLINGRTPDWSPDGRYVAFGKRTNSGRDIFVYDMKTNHAEQLTHNSRRNRDPCWSKDGGFIFFESDRSGYWAIYRMRRDGSDVTQLTHFRGGDMTAACGP